MLLRASLTAFVALSGEPLEAFRLALLRAFAPVQGELFSDRPPVQVLPAVNVKSLCVVCPECFEAFAPAFTRAALAAYESVTVFNQKKLPSDAQVMADKRKARTEKRGNRPTTEGASWANFTTCAAPHCSRDGRPTAPGALWVCPKHRRMLSDETIEAMRNDTPEARDAIEADVSEVRGESGSLFDPYEGDLPCPARLGLSGERLTT